MDPVGVPLSRPALAYGEEIASISLRAPLGGDIQACGAPFGVRGDGVLLIDTEAMARLIVALAAVPASTVDGLPATDWSALSAAVMRACLSAAGPVPALRAPLGRDLRTCGVPYAMVGGVTTYAAPAMGKMIAALAGLEAEAVAAMPAPDWLAAAEGVMGFFASPAAVTSTPPASSGPTGTPPGSGETPTSSSGSASPTSSPSPNTASDSTS